MKKAPAAARNYRSCHCPESAAASNHRSRHSPESTAACRTRAGMGQRAHKRETHVSHWKPLMKKECVRGLQKLKRFCTENKKKGEHEIWGVFVRKAVRK